MFRKHLIGALLLLGATFSLNAQTQVYKFVEAMPSFQGNLTEFLSSNLRYPDSAREANVEGRSVVEFTVQTTGLVSDVHIVKTSGSDLLDDEALRVVRMMQLQPYWKPGQQKGVAVPVFFTLPITFKLDKPEAEKTATAQGPEVDITRLAREMVRSKVEGAEHYFVFWAPTEYWLTALLNSGKLPESTIKMIERELQPYAIFWVSQFRVGSLGKLIADDAASVRREFVLRDANGKQIPVLKTAELPASLNEILKGMKPAFAQMMGDFGNGVHILVAKNTNAAGKLLLDPKTAGSFSIDFFGQHFNYTTPVTALMPARRCPRDGAQMEGSWLYCPWHGVPLE